MSAPGQERILLVDDEPNVLASYSRTLRKHFAVECAPSAQDALRMIDAGEDFAVIVSDMRMPGVDGVTFLAQVKQRAPQSVRMMLTGNADQQTAIDAVNEGNIFRFLTKPCAPERLIRMINAGCRQYRLATAERELLERTLRGSVDILIEMLSLLSPEIFGRSQRLKRYMRHMASAQRLEDIWQYELAAALSQLGCISLSAELMEKVNAGQPLEPSEERLLAAHPAVGQRLIGKIPRLEAIGQMVAEQGRPYSSFPVPEVSGARGAVTLGAQMLHVAIEYDQQVTRGVACGEVLARMHARAGEYNPRLLALLEPLNGLVGSVEIRTVRLSDLVCGMVVHEDILARNGMTLVAKRQVITQPVLERLNGFQQGIGIIEPILIVVASTGAANALPDGRMSCAEEGPRAGAAANGDGELMRLREGDEAILASLSGWSARVRARE